MKGKWLYIFPASFHMLEARALCGWVWEGFLSCSHVVLRPEEGSGALQINVVRDRMYRFNKRRIYQKMQG